MTTQQCVVKRYKGICQPYDPKKVYGSVYAACYVAKMGSDHCEHIAEKVMKEITRFVKGKQEISSVMIKKKAATTLRKLHKDAAFLYETHEDVN